MYNYQSTKLKYTILQQKISSSPQITTAISVCSCQYPSFLPENGLQSDDEINPEFYKIKFFFVFLAVKLKSPAQLGSHQGL